jgi:hypothetical protein
MTNRLFKHEHVKSKMARIRRYVLSHPNTECAAVAKKFDVDLQVVYNARWTLRKLANKNIKTIRPKKDIQIEVSPTPEAKPEMPVQMVDMVNQPPHYTVGGIETIDYIKAKLSKEEYRGYLRGNILKYGSRVGHKGSTAEDAGKLAWYAKRLAELEE